MKLAQIVITNYVGEWYVDITKGLNNFYLYVKFITPNGKIAYLDQAEAKTLKSLKKNGLLKLVTAGSAILKTEEADIAALNEAFTEAEAVYVTSITGP
jgi:hypothetical protein